MSVRDGVVVHGRGVKSFLEPPEIQALYAPYQSLTTAVLPKMLDYTDGFFPVENQGPFGTCVAFGTGALFEYWFRRKNGAEAKSVSKRAIFSIARRTFDPGSLADDGLSVYQGLKALERAYVFESVWPYERTDFRALLDLVPGDDLRVEFRIAAYQRVPTDIVSIKSALRDRGPLVIGLNFFDSWSFLKYPGLLNAPTPTDSWAGHCVVIVGYNDAKGALKIRNSWAEDWADRGYCWMPYDFEQNQHRAWPQQAYAAVVT